VSASYKTGRVIRTLHVDTGRQMRGGQWQALYLLEGLRGAGMPAVLLAPARSPLLKQAAARGIDARPLSFARLWRLARRFDLVHAHDARAHTLAAAAGGAPLVVSRRVGFPLQRGFLSSWKYARAALYLAVSKFTAARLMEAGVRGTRIRVVPDGVPLPAPGTPAPGRVIALASKPVEIPGIPVHLTDKLWEDLSTTSVFVYKSEMEGLGSAALAAMSAGVPVVASAAGGLVEAVEQGITGFLVTDGDFASPVRRLLEDPELAARMGRAGRERVEREYSVDVMIEKTLRAYREVVS
jgi:glycosyltransferase involved in cell wall biosynthesis